MKTPLPFLLLLSSAQTAFAQEAPAVERALEIGVAGIYSQGTGALTGGGGGLQDIAGAGGGVELQVGYRATRHFTVGAYGNFAALAPRDSVPASTQVFTSAVGLRADWHLRPGHTVDPWVSLGTGWRGLWLVPDAHAGASLHGFDVVRAQVGVDYRLSSRFALAPMLSAGMTLFVAQDGRHPGEPDNIADPRPNVSFTAGLMARFDLFGRATP